MRMGGIDLQSRKDSLPVLISGWTGSEISQAAPRRPQLQSIRLWIHSKEDKVLRHDCIRAFARYLLILEEGKLDSTLKH